MFLPQKRVIEMRDMLGILQMPVSFAPWDLLASSRLQRHLHMYNVFPHRYAHICIIKYKVLILATALLKK